MSGSPPPKIDHTYPRIIKLTAVTSHIVAKEDTINI